MTQIMFPVARVNAQTYTFLRQSGTPGAQAGQGSRGQGTAEHSTAKARHGQAGGNTSTSNGTAGGLTKEV